MNLLGDLAPSWPQLNRLLDEALALPPPERAHWLHALPAEHAALKDTLARLLDVRAGIETGDFLGTLPKLDGAPGGAAATGAPDIGAPQSGDEVGPWRLIRELGEGGMGSVWLAERADGQLKRQVALKLPRLTWARGLAERMARERDILATLEHPHIARLYDAGVDRLGRPWLALEYVQGQPIDAYARDKALTVRQRVELLLQVCEAVAYAHSRLVIHRDLKPSNILVTDDGQVKLLDFGIAKLMQGEQADATALTELAGRALTLDYASPEQVRGEALTTASDVYSLGVVAYEVLAGAKPYRLKRGSAAELEEAIQVAEIPPASRAAGDAATRSALRGDLDAVLQKALQRQPEGRYAGVGSFAEDLRAVLEGRAVRARRDTVRQWVWRQLRRHGRYVSSAVAVVGAFALAIGVGATTLVMVALTAGLGAALWQAARARQGRREAEEATARATAAAEAATREAARAGAIGDFMVQVFSSTTDKQADPEAARSRTAAELLARGVAQIDTLQAAHPHAHAQLLRTFGELMLELGQHADARSLFERALDRARSVFGNEHLETQWARTRLASFLIGTSRGAEARALVEQAHAVLARIAPRSEAMAETLSELCSQILQRNPERAIAVGHEAVTLMDRLPSSRTGYREGLARQRLGRAYRYADDADAAERWLTEAQQRWDAQFGPESTYATEARRDRAQVLLLGGRYDEALQAWREVRALFESQRSTPVDSLCETLRGLATTHLMLGDPAAALGVQNEVLALLDRGAAPRLGSGQRWLTQVHRAIALVATGELDAALELARSVRVEVPPDLAVVRTQALRVMAEVMLRRGEYGAMADVEAELLPLFEVRRGTTFQRQEVLGLAAAGAAGRGDAALARGRLAQAEAALSPRAPAHRRAFVTAVAKARVEIALGTGGRSQVLQSLASEWLPVLAVVPRDLPRLLQCELGLMLVAAAPTHADAASSFAPTLRHLRATQAVAAPLRAQAEALTRAHPKLQPAV